MELVLIINVNLSIYLAWRHTAEINNRYKSTDESISVVKVHILEV